MQFERTLQAFEEQLGVAHLLVPGVAKDGKLACRRHPKSRRGLCTHVFIVGNAAQLTLLEKLLLCSAETQHLLVRDATLAVEPSTFA
jgi:hypothetical protein